MPTNERLGRITSPPGRHDRSPVDDGRLDVVIQHLFHAGLLLHNGSERGGGGEGAEARQHLLAAYRELADIVHGPDGFVG